MSPAAIDDPILKRFRAALDEMYGDRLERVVLFGSRARGHRERIRITTWRCFCGDMADRFAEMDRLADLSTKIIVEEDGPFIHAMPYRAGSYGERTPLMLTVRSDGVDL